MGLRTLRKFDGLKAGHPLLSDGWFCVLCHRPFAVGDETALVPLGPDPEAPAEVAKAAAGQPHRAVGLPVHWACAVSSPAGRPD